MAIHAIGLMAVTMPMRLAAASTVRRASWSSGMISSRSASARRSPGLSTERSCSAKRASGHCRSARPPSTFFRWRTARRSLATSFWFERLRHLLAQRAETGEAEHAEDLAQDEHHGREADDAQQREGNPADPILARERDLDVAREPQRGRQHEQAERRRKRARRPSGCRGDRSATVGRTVVRAA